MLSPHERLNSRLFFLFFTFVLVNLLDLSTTIVAVNMGFREANYALVALSNFAGTGIVTTILLLKIIFIIGVGTLVMISVKSHNFRISKMVMRAEEAMTILFLIVALSNILVIALS